MLSRNPHVLSLSKRNTSTVVCAEATYVNLLSASHLRQEYPWKWQQFHMELTAFPQWIIEKFRTPGYTCMKAEGLNFSEDVPISVRTAWKGGSTG